MIHKILGNISCALFSKYKFKKNKFKKNKLQKNKLHYMYFSQNDTSLNSKFQNGKLRRYQIVFTVFVVAVCLGGCGKGSKEDDAFAAFSDSVTSFSNTLKEADAQLNGLDVNSEDAADQMLEILDNLDNAFAQFAALSVPEDAQYQSIETLADEASQNMADAVSHYHAAFESEAYSSYDADLAYQYYIRAMERVEYIGHLLSGNEIPENDHVTVHEESNDKEILDKILPED